METIKTFILLISFLLILFFHVDAQNVEIIGDTIEIQIDGYKTGEIQWQFSKDKQTWENLTNSNSEKLTCKVTKTGFFRAKVENGNCPYFSDETFIYTPFTDNSFPKITDEGAKLKIQWDFNISPLLVSRYFVTVEGKDTTIEVTGKNNELLLPRKMEYYNKTFYIKAFTNWGLQLPHQTIRYENNYTKFFTCKNKYIAHRGLSALYPENTAIAFEKANEAGFEYVECDIWLTKDHQWVVIHDETIDRTSDGTGKVSQYTFDELQKFNFGNTKSFGSKYPQKISSIKEFVELCKSKNVKPLIELKHGASDQDYRNLLQIVNNVLPYEKYALNSFGPSTLYSIRKIDNEVILGLITGIITQNNFNDLKSLYPCFYNINVSQAKLDQPFNSVLNSDIFKLYSNGTIISIWIVNDPKYFDNLSQNNMFILTDILPPIFK